MKRQFLILMVITAVLLSGCTRQGEAVSGPTVPTQEEKPDNVYNTMSETAVQYGITHENYPRMDGSTSTQGIVMAINRAMYRYLDNENLPLEVSKTVPSYKRLIAGEVDLILVPYPSSEVLALAQESGVELEFHPVAAEALIFITPAENPADNITGDQVRTIYLDYGIQSWSGLGGPDKELIPICRNADSGSQSQLDNLVLYDQPMHPKIQKNYVELTMEGMLELVAFYHHGGLDGQPTDSYALGYTLYTYLQNMNEVTGIGSRLKILSFEGVEPTEENIAKGTYSLADGYYAVLKKDLPEGHSARGILSWLQSDEAVAAIKAQGFIPLGE
ncbi:PstS family phosphate ABC transporter substrate-binding protein [Desulfitobacterium chlororespirans]|uniref:Phosphate ABC transporter substrate-binding protein, PhoT family n=1 Tax=Desulfitobacterium chlororespirans DSM 11544 TaxID=1121395 RepID=A0A1M7TIN6_9FIRM|nr:substrate-binding domain-containing protein [Desulfitobacterium chlororespirans]SHN70580.1 phosphate ABC transporter substrate-binding protein, PhoT family [Desulfitobacterium chlororespirans DSM 11544]